MARLSCLVADDHPAVLDAVCRLVDAADELELVGYARDGAEALRLIEKLQPAVAVLDVRMPEPDGIEIARRLSASGPGTPKTAVMLYTGYPDRSFLLEALDAGARGFLGKEARLDELLRAIKVVGGGGTYIDPGLMSFLVGPRAAERMPVVTKREREILRLLADGMRNEQVARQLNISPLTVRSHVQKAMEKLEADTRTQAVARALRESLIS